MSNIYDLIIDLDDHATAYGGHEDEYEATKQAIEANFDRLLVAADTLARAAQLDQPEAYRAYMIARDSVV